MDESVSKSTFRWKKLSNVSHNEINFSPRSIGSVLTITTSTKRYETDTQRKEIDTLRYDRATQRS